MVDLLYTSKSAWSAMILLALVVGWLEQQAYTHGYRDQGWHLFGWLNPRHHIPMILGILIACYAAKVWWFTPAFLVVEDAAYFLFNPKDDLDKDDWIARGLGGFSVGRIFVPWVYVAGITLTIFFLWIAR